MQGNKLREYRRRIGVTTRQVSKAVGCSQPLIVRIENGKRTASDELKVALSQYFGVPITELFFQPADASQTSVAGAAR